MRFKDADIDSSFDAEFAHLKEEHTLDKYSLEELEAEFHLLCGERAADICTLAAKHRDKESVMVLMNLAIHLANEIGAPTPRSTPLQAERLLPGRLHYKLFILTHPSGHAVSGKRTATATSPPASANAAAADISTDKGIYICCTCLG